MCKNTKNIWNPFNFTVNYFETLSVLFILIEGFFQCRDNPSQWSLSNSLILYGKYLEVPGSPTGFKLINLLTPTPSDNRQHIAHLSRSLCISRSRPASSLFSPRASSYKLAENVFCYSIHTKWKPWRAFSCANDAKKNSAGAARLSEVPAVSLYLRALVWGKILLI